MVNLRVFGEFRYKISNPANFVNQFVGTFNYASSEEVEVRIKQVQNSFATAQLAEKPAAKKTARRRRPRRRKKPPAASE